MSDTITTEVNSLRIEALTAGNTVTVNPQNNGISVLSEASNINITVEDAHSITLLESDGVVIVQGEGAQGPPGVDAQAGDAQTLNTVKLAGGAFTYISEVLDIITYEDYEGSTAHTKQLTYTTGKLTQTTEIFTYEAQVWTVTIDFIYTGDTLTSKTNPIIVKV